MQIEPTDILVAPPSLRDDRFSETVILLINHASEMGSIGLCLNRPLFMTVEDILEDENIHHDFEDLDVFWGGPVQEETLWILHTSDWEIENTIQITDEWSITSHSDMFSYLHTDSCPTIMRLFMGYCSWDAGQLLAELTGVAPFEKNESWLTINSASPEEVLEADLEDMWEQACEIACVQAAERIL